MTDTDTTSDALKILKHRYGEPSQEARDELADTDLQIKLAAACEKVGIEAHGPIVMDDETGEVIRIEKHLPTPDLLERLEAWARGLSGYKGWGLYHDPTPRLSWRAAFIFEGESLFDFPEIVDAFAAEPEAARAEAVLAVAEKEKP